MKTSALRVYSLMVLAFLFLAGMTAKSYAQARPSSASNVISIDPIGLLSYGALSLQYEWKSSPVNSFAIRGEFVRPVDQYSAFGLGGAYRFYVADSRALTGLSVAPAVDLFFFSSSALDRTATIVSIGGDLAYKWIFDQFSVEPLVGLRIGIGGSTSIGSYTGFLPVIGVYLGYAWH